MDGIAPLAGGRLLSRRGQGLVSNAHRARSLFVVARGGIPYAPGESQRRVERRFVSDASLPPPP